MPILLPPNDVIAHRSSALRLVVLVGRTMEADQTLSPVVECAMRTRFACVHAAHTMPVESLAIVSDSVEKSPITAGKPASRL